MFAIIKKVLAKVVKVIGVAVGIAVAVAMAPAVLSLFGTGALAGATVTAAEWVGNKAVTLFLPALMSLVQSMGLVAVATLLLAGIMLLGIAGLILDLAEKMACTVIDGYRCVRPARRPAA